MSDAIDQAIASDGRGPAVRMVQIGPIAIAGTGRPFMVMVPADLTDAELLEITGWLADPAGMRTKLPGRNQRRIVVPGPGVRV